MTYEYYCAAGKGYFYKFMKANPEFNTEEFTEFVTNKNKADRDSGELQDIAKFEILRLAFEFEEMKARFPNVYGEKQ